MEVWSDYRKRRRRRLLRPFKQIGDRYDRWREVEKELGDTRREKRSLDNYVRLSGEARRVP